MQLSWTASNYSPSSFSQAQSIWLWARRTLHLQPWHHRQFLSQPFKEFHQAEFSKTAPALASFRRGLFLTSALPKHCIVIHPLWITCLVSIVSGPQRWMALPWRPGHIGEFGGGVLHTFLRGSWHPRGSFQFYNGLAYRDLLDSVGKEMLVYWLERLKFWAYEYWYLWYLSHTF